jgi:hypothetical protein
MPKYVIDITLPDIEYLKSAAAVESDKPKAIWLLSFNANSSLTARWTLYQAVIVFF